MRQLSYSGGVGHNQLQQISERFRGATEEQQTEALDMAGDALATLSIGLVDTDSIRLYAPRKPRVVNGAVEVNYENDLESRKKMFLQSAVDLAFNFSSSTQRDYVVNALSEGHRIHSQNLPIPESGFSRKIMQMNNPNRNIIFYLIMWKNLWKAIFLFGIDIISRS